MTESEIAKNLEGVALDSNKKFFKEVVEPAIKQASEGSMTAEQFTELNEKIVKFTSEGDEKFAKMQKAIEDKVVNANNVYGDGFGAFKSQGDIINEILQEKGFDSYQKNPNSLEDLLKKAKNFDIPVQKATQSLANIGAGVIIPQRTTQEIQRNPDSPFHVSDVFDRGSTTLSNTISYTVQNSYTDGMALINEGDVYPETNQTLQEIVDNIRIIATMEIFTAQILRNVPRLIGFIFPQLVEKLKLLKDAQSLFGTNVGNQMRGVAMGATPFAYSAGQMGDKVIAPNILDLIVKGKLLATNIFHTPNIALVNSADWSNVTCEKTSDKDYVFKDNVLVNGKSKLQVIDTPLMPQGKIIIGAFNSAAELITQVAPSIQLSDQMYFTSNKVVARIQNECAMQVIQPKAFVLIDNIDGAITALTKV